MSSVLTNLSVIQQLAKQLVRCRQLNYSQQCIPYYVDETKFILENIEDLTNASSFNLKSTLIKHRYPNEQIDSNQRGNQSTDHERSCKNENVGLMNQKCIVYLHGLGSSRLEALPLVEFLPVDYCMLAFDCSGSGKSEGDNITYGLRQSEDIEAIMEYLRIHKCIKQFIVWGRSMGAVATLLYALNLKKTVATSLKSSVQISRIKGIVLDSPFCDFKQITKQIALQRMSVPQFLIDFALTFINQSFQETMKDESRGGKVYNPFSIQFGNQMLETTIPTIFMYSTSDEVVPKEHSQKIIKNYKSAFEKIVMEGISHNQSRPQNYVNRVFEVLKKFEMRYNKERRKMSMDNLGQHSRKNSNINFEDDQCTQMRGMGRGRSRGITVQSKEKKRKNSQEQYLMQVIATEQSEKNPKKDQKGLNNSKEEQKRSKVSCNSRNNKETSPLRLRMSNSMKKTEKVKQIPTNLNYDLQKTFGIANGMQSLYNRIDHSSNEIVKRKLMKYDTTPFPEKDESKNNPSFKGRRFNQLNRKVEYQLNHTRYL